MPPWHLTLLNPNNTVWMEQMRNGLTLRSTEGSQPYCHFMLTVPMLLKKSRSLADILPQNVSFKVLASAMPIVHTSSGFCITCAETVAKASARPTWQELHLYHRKYENKLMWYNRFWKIVVATWNGMSEFKHSFFLTGYPNWHLLWDAKHTLSQKVHLSIGFQISKYTCCKTEQYATLQDRKVCFEKMCSIN